MEIDLDFRVGHQANITDVISALWNTAEPAKGNEVILPFSGLSNIGSESNFDDILQQSINLFPMLQQTKANLHGENCDFRHANLPAVLAGTFSYFAA